LLLWGAQCGNALAALSQVLSGVGFGALEAGNFRLARFLPQKRYLRLLFAAPLTMMTVTTTMAKMKTA